MEYDNLPISRYQTHPHRQRSGPFGPSTFERTIACSMQKHLLESNAQVELAFLQRAPHGEVSPILLVKVVPAHAAVVHRKPHHHGRLSDMATVALALKVGAGPRVA